VKHGPYGERIAISAVAELELTFEIGAPEIIGASTFRQRCAAGSVTRPAHALNQAMSIEDRMNGALCRHPDIAVQSADQKLANLARSPVRLVALGGDDQAFDLLRQLVGISHGPARTIAQRLLAVFFVTIEDLVAGFARYAEFTAGPPSALLPGAGR